LGQRRKKYFRSDYFGGFDPTASCRLADPPPEAASLPLVLVKVIQVWSQSYDFDLQPLEILSHEIVCPQIYFSYRGSSATSIDI
jgi:hypothetical protein